MDNVIHLSCPECNGKGYHTHVGERDVFSYSCGRCKGKGMIQEAPVIAEEDVRRVLLAERTPDDWYQSSGTDGKVFVAFHFGATLDGVQRLPVGGRFGVVYSPNPYVDPHSPLAGWYYVIFEVCLSQFHADKGMERGYRQVSRRPLDRWEVEHFESLWSEVQHGKSH